MGQVRLTDEEIQKLIECIQSDAEVPEYLLPKLSPKFFEKLRAAGKFDYKELDKYKIPVLEYAGKRAEAVLLAQAAIIGGAAPLQGVRSFGKSSDDEWRNLIVQGDNLHFLKTCYMNNDPMVKDKIKGKVKLVYIDPPFGTGDEYGGSGGLMSYSAKIKGSEFVEFLRERIVFLKELLSPDGIFFIRLDYHFGHYIKVALDEIFGKTMFQNELVINRIHKNVFKGSKFIPTSTDSLYVYFKTPAAQFKCIVKKRKETREGFWRHMDDSAGSQNNPSRDFFGLTMLPPNGKHFKFSQDNIASKIQEKKLRIKCKNCGEVYCEGIVKKCNSCGKVVFRPEYWVEASDTLPLQSDWTDIPGYSFSTGYPTENSEILLERVISVASIEKDLIIDVFGGSGTTAAVAEKLGRRWVVCDFGKHAIYTIQKRILNIAESNKLNGNGSKKENYGEKPKPFDVISAGAYDFSKIINLRDNKEDYISFVLGLFGIIQENVNFSKKYKLPNIYGEKEGDPVEVYPIWEDEYLKEIRIDEEYLKGIIVVSGGKLKGDYYVITPETCTVIGNTILKNSQKEDVRFHMLKFPYKVLEDVSRQFQIEEQPNSANNINSLISSSAFYFNEVVDIEVRRVKDGLEILKATSRILNKKKQLYKDIDCLAMILIDREFNGKAFNMDEVRYSVDIKENRLIKVEGISAKAAIIAIDKHGNESKIIKT